MVQVSAYAVRQTKDKKRTFITLELNGGLEIIPSQKTGKQYATIRKCSIPSTFNEETAKLVVGKELPGYIVKVPCEPYEYVNKTTGEVMLLNYSFGYQQSPESQVIGETQVELA